MSYEASLSIKVELVEDVALEIRNLGILIDQRIVLASPVDTGNFRANWLMSIGSPETRILSEQEALAANPVADAFDVALTYPKDSLPDLWLVNNLPYAARLNDGWSEQAPSKFVEREIAQAVNNGR